VVLVVGGDFDARCADFPDPPLVDFLVWDMLEARGDAGLATSGAGALPLLSHALDQAWRRRVRPGLTLNDNERGGPRCTQHDTGRTLSYVERD
jgi:hypothetical protein